MNVKTVLTITWVCILTLLFPIFSTIAEELESTNYKLIGVTTQGGGITESDNYRSLLTIGNLAADPTLYSSTYKMYADPAMAFRPAVPTVSCFETTTDGYSNCLTGPEELITGGMIALCGGGGCYDRARFEIDIKGTVSQSNLPVTENLVLHLDAQSLPHIYDDFTESTLNSDIWDTFGEQHGSISISNGELTISQTSGGGSGNNLIGIASKQKFPIGSSYRARVKNTSGRHAAVIGFGASPWPNYPHGGNDVGVTWYSRADNVTSVISYCDENLSKGSNSSITQDLRDYQEIEIYRVNETTVEIYRNDSLEHTITALEWEEDYSIYFSLDGHTTPNTVVIDWIEADIKDESNIAKWPDISGLNNHATQTNINKRPIYKKDTTNNIPAIRFDGQSEQHSLELPDFLSSNTEGEIFAVLWIKNDPPIDANDSGIWRFGNVSTNTHYPFTNGDSYLSWGRNTRFGPITNVIETLEDPHILNISSSSNWIMRQNGIEAFNTSSGSAGFRSDPAIGESPGGNRWLDGYFAEILIYDTVLSSSDRELIEEYLSGKWLTKTNPPDTLYAVEISIDNFSSDIRYIDGSTNEPKNFLTLNDFRTKEQWENDTYNILGLAEGTQYYIRILALHGDFTQTEQGPSATATTAGTSSFFDIDIADEGGIEVDTNPPYNIYFTSENSLLAGAGAVTADNLIWFDAETNGNGGFAIVQRGSNGGLYSTTHSLQIDSVNGDLNSLSEGFGLQNYYIDYSASPGLGEISSTPNYSNSGNNVGIVDTDWNKIYDGNGPIVGGRMALYIKARAAADKLGATDYNEIVTFVFVPRY